MNHQDFKSKLDDYVDGELTDAVREVVESHLQTCAECRREVEELVELGRDAAELPRAIEPQRDLWPEIGERIARPALVDRSLWPLRYPLAAAAVLLIAVSSATTAIVVYRLGAGRTSGGGPPSSTSADWLVAELPYTQAAEELRATLEENRQRLAPETIARIEANLEVIDQAIGETREALQADPADANLRRMLWSAHQAKIDVLQGVNRLIAST
jgi:anti-sigma factor RsiW